MHTANKQGVASENSSFIAILEEVANTVLSVAWRMKSGDFNSGSDVES